MNFKFFCSASSWSDASNRQARYGEFPQSLSVMAKAQEAFGSSLKYKAL